MFEFDIDSLVEKYETVAGECLRIVLTYEGDEYETTYVRDDVENAYSPEEFDEKLKQLVVDGLSDPPTQEQFRQFGDTEVIIRRFEKAIVLHYPLDEFTGAALTFDRDPVPSLGTLADIGSEYLQAVDNQ